MKTSKEKNNNKDELRAKLEGIFCSYYRQSLSENIKRGIARKKLLGVRVNK
jgi:hypothetical protein